MGVPDKYNIAIVEGGIAGLYCYLQTDSGKRAALFKSTNWMGERIKTVSITKKLSGKIKNGVY